MAEVTVPDEEARLFAHAWARAHGKAVDPEGCDCDGCVRGMRSFVIRTQERRRVERRAAIVCAVIGAIVVTIAVANLLVDVLDWFS